MMLPFDAPVRLERLNVDPSRVFAAGLGDAADWAHQFHVAFSATVAGACVFSGQPFNCATSGFSGDPQSWHDKMRALNGSASSTNDHCKSDPDVVDVGSLVDNPRRHCGQNPVWIHECFDDVNHVKGSRSFLFRGMADNVSAAGSIENVDALLAQMVTDPQRGTKVVRDLPFGHVLPIPSTPRHGESAPAGCAARRAPPSRTRSHPPPSPRAASTPPPPPHPTPFAPPPPHRAASPPPTPSQV